MERDRRGREDRKKERGTIQDVQHPLSRNSRRVHKKTIYQIVQKQRRNLKPKDKFPDVKGPPNI